MPVVFVVEVQNLICGQLSFWMAIKTYISPGPACCTNFGVIADINHAVNPMAPTTTEHLTSRDSAEHNVLHD